MGATQAPVEWISPGLSALFEALSGDRGYSILDLADHAGNSHLEVLGQFSRQIRFAGLAPSPPHGDAFASALLELPPGPCAYDIVLAWDVMDRLGPHERERLMDYLVEVTAPRAWLHAVVDSSGDESAPPLRFTLIDLDRVSRQAVGPPEPLAPQLLPRHARSMSVKSGVKSSVSTGAIFSMTLCLASTSQPAMMTAPMAQHGITHPVRSTSTSRPMAPKMNTVIPVRTPPPAAMRA